MSFLLKELSGTKEQSFKFGDHKLSSTDSAALIATKEDIALLSVSFAKLTVNPFSFYWGTGPLTKGTHNVGDIVWNVNQSNPDSVLCWRCVSAGSPGQWQPQFANPLQLPKEVDEGLIAQFKGGQWSAAAPQLPTIADEGSIAQFIDGEWQAVDPQLPIGLDDGVLAQYRDGQWQYIAVSDLAINSGQIVLAEDKNFITDSQLAVISGIKGTNTGDETRKSILAKLGPASSDQAGYLTVDDFDRLNVAYSAAGQISQLVSDIPTKLSDLEDDLNVALVSAIPTKLSVLTNDVGFITRFDLPTKLSQLDNDLELDTSVIPTKLSELTNDIGAITAATVPTKLSDLYNDLDFDIFNPPTKLSDLRDDIGVLTAANAPTKLSDLRDDLGVITQSQVPFKLSDLRDDIGLVSASDLPINLSDLRDDIGVVTQVSLISDLNDFKEFIDSTTLAAIPDKLSDLEDDIGFVKQEDAPTKLSDLRDDIGIVSVFNSPTKLSDLEDDLGVITESNSPTKLSDLRDDIGVITRATVPTKLSDLTNDIEVITAANVPSKISDLEDDIDIATLSNIPTKVSQLTNDSGFAKIASVPTKLSDLSDDIGVADLNVPSKLSDLEDDLGVALASRVPVRVGQLSNDVGYLTRASLPTRLSEFINDIEIDKVIVPTKLSAFTNDAGYALKSELPVRVSQLANDADYITLSSIPTKLSQFINDLTLTDGGSAITRTSQLNNDSGFITGSMLAQQRLDDLLDVEIRSSALDDGDALTFSIAKNKWVAGEVSYASSINNVRPVKGNISLTTSNIPEGSNKYFTEQRAAQWASQYLSDISLADLDGVNIVSGVGDAFLYYSDGQWQARSVDQISSLAIDNLNDVEVRQPLLNNELLTYSNGRWRGISLVNNPNFNLDSLLNVEITALQGDQILIYDSNLRKWVNAEIDFASGTITSNQYTTLASLNDTYFNGFNLLNGSVLTYNTTEGRWEPSLPSSSVSSVNTKTGAVNLTTADIPESGNFYYTTERVDARISQRLGSISLNDILGVGAESAAVGAVLHYNGDYWQALPIAQLNIDLTDINGFEFSNDAVGRDILIRENDQWVPRSVDVLLETDFGELMDVIITDPQQSQVAAYDVPTSSWVNVDVEDIYKEWLVKPVTSSDYTASNRDLIPCDTSIASFVITTPASGKFRVVDLIGTSPDTGFGANNLTIEPAAGTTIMGGALGDNLILDVGAISPEFTLVGTEWRVSNHG